MNIYIYGAGDQCTKDDAFQLEVFMRLLEVSAVTIVFLL